MERKIILSIILTLVLLPILGQSYIQVIKSDAIIRFAPSSSSTEITKAKEGNVFELKNENGDWYEIIMFSGEYRYIHQTMCKKYEYSVDSLNNESLRKTVFIEFLKVEDKATVEADRKYPYDIFKNIDYNRILTDKFKLNIINDHNLQPPVYSKIVSEGIRKKWDR